MSPFSIADRVPHDSCSSPVDSGSSDCSSVSRANTSSTKSSSDSQPPPQQHRHSQVRVAVRVRPLTPSEQRAGHLSAVSVCSKSGAVTVGNCNAAHGKHSRKFTFDAAFDSSVSQLELYRSLSDQLLTSFLEGYNATVSGADVV